MFKLHYRPTNSAVNWKLIDGDLVCRYGRVEPYQHPMVETRALVEVSGRIGIAIFERPHPDPDKAESAIRLQTIEAWRVDEEFARAKAFLERWPLHWFWIEIDADAVFIESSSLPTVPVFVAENKDIALVDWDPLKLYPYIEPIIDKDAAAYYLTTFEQPYGPRTILQQMRRVAAGYKTEWRRGRLWNIIAPRSVSPPYAQELTKTADPLRSFEGLLEETLKRILPNQATSVATQLSGGLDSSTVTAQAKRNGHPTSAFGIIMPGQEGIIQNTRRQAVVERLGIADYSFDPLENELICADYGHATPNSMVPWEELLYDTFDCLYTKASATGHTVILSGFGGDELLHPYWDEIPDKDAEMAKIYKDRDLPDFLGLSVQQGQQERTEIMRSTPTTFTQSCVMETAAGIASQCLRNNLWPIHPLITPEVVKYTHKLPQQWRHNRRLMRETLSRWGMPTSVTHPMTTENFSLISTLALKNCTTSHQGFFSPKLADLGLVKPTQATNAFQQWSTGKAPSSWDIYFIAIAVLESTLNAVENTCT